MARTGSGKTAAFVIPMIEKLRAHSAAVGARALIMSPSRELALQTLKVVKELGRGTDLRSVLLVGGDSLETQFELMTANPDIIIATPGRFLHLQVEMSLDLSSIRYVVFDEADRLFEMGFAVQLTEILHALPASRQTLLFSATLPKSLVEFARAGLQEPRLIRLDAESKVSPDLKSAFFAVKSVEKEGALLHVLSDVIKIPLVAPKTVHRPDEEGKNDGDGGSRNKKRKRIVEKVDHTDSPTAYSTIVFAATKHHVEYLATLLRDAGFSVSHAYGSLDQMARRRQVEDFRIGSSHILVVTDVAARGIDIPILANVVNYDFPSQPKIFVHRVGRTARAGRAGHSYSLVSAAEAPYLLDLQLFLGRRLVLGQVSQSQPAELTQDIVVGALSRENLGRSDELFNKMLRENSDLVALRSVAVRGEKLYNRTRSNASLESIKRAKTIVASKDWTVIHPLFRESDDSLEHERELMLARVGRFRPQETVFEIGKRANGTVAAEFTRKQREKSDQRKKTQVLVLNVSDVVDEPSAERALPGHPATGLDDEDDEGIDQVSASDEEIEITFSNLGSSKTHREKQSWKDKEHFMEYMPTSINTIEERGYGVHSGSAQSNPKSAHFAEMARRATVELAKDEGTTGLGGPSRAGGQRWDKKSKNYVSRANDEDGSKGGKMIRSESGQKISASFRGGRFDAWKKTQRISRVPRVGEAESRPGSTSTIVRPGGAKIDSGGGRPDRHFRHRQERAPKEADRFRDDYHERKRRVKEAQEKRIGRFREGKGRNELKSVDDVRKQRKLTERRRQKNARPSKHVSRR